MTSVLPAIGFVFGMATLATATVYVNLAPAASTAPPPAVVQPAPVQEDIVEVSDCLAAVWAAQEARTTGAWNRFEVLAESCEAGEVDRG